MYSTIAMYETNSGTPIQLRSCSRMHRDSLMKVMKRSYIQKRNRLLTYWKRNVLYNSRVLL